MDTFLFTRIVFDLLDSFKGSKSFVYIRVNDKKNYEKLQVLSIDFNLMLIGIRVPDNFFNDYLL